MKQINNINIDKSTMPTVATSKVLEVSGDKDARFMLFCLQTDVAFDQPVKFYNFIIDEFENGNNGVNNNPIITLDKSGFYSKLIHFPAGGGEYMIKLIAVDDTLIQGKNHRVLSFSKQAATTQITFTPTTSTSNYATLPTKVTTGESDGYDSFDINWSVLNVSNDDYGFGFKTPADLYLDILPGELWYHEFNVTIDGAAEHPGTSKTSTKFNVDNLENIVAGHSIITGVSADSLSGTPIVVDVNLTDNLIYLSGSNQTLSDNTVLTLRNYGPKPISEGLGIKIMLKGFYLKPTELVKTIRAGSSGNTINLNGTYGIAGGNTVSITGLNVNNSSSNLVSTVAESSSAGSIVVQSSQTGLVTGSELVFNGCHQEIVIVGSVSVDRYPATNTTIKLDLDQFITVGTDGS